MLSRREFVGACAAISAGATAGLGALDAAQQTAAAAPGGRKSRALRKAVMIGMCAEGTTLADKFKILRDAGFEGVELNSPDKNLTTDMVLKASEQTGIKVHGVVDSTHWKYYLNAPDDSARDQAVADLKSAIGDAKAWGASSVLLVPAMVNQDLPYDSAWQRSIDSIRRALPVAEESKIKIAIENVWNNFHLSPLEAARYVDEFKSPWVVWHLDLGNLEAFGWGEQWTRILGKRVWKLHIKEYSRKKRNDLGLWKGFEVDLLEGDNNWPQIMKALDDVGYTSGESRWATAEIGGGDARRMKEISEKMDKIFAL